MTWTSFGLFDAWVARHLTPICERHADYLNHTDPPPQAQQLWGPESNWDVLFLGCETPEAAGCGTLEAIIDRISAAHPFECVVAVAPADGAERQLALMRAGASDVITSDSHAERIEQALERAITLAQARQRQCEQQKLRVISQLAISVNHEINNPLTGLMGTVELILLENRALDEKVRRDLQTVIGQCHRIQEITARLKSLNHLRTVPYGSHDEMIDLVGPIVTQAAAPPPTPPDNLFPAPRILVVDDNPLIIDLIGRLFEQRFVMDAASCASDALSKLERHNYDLVLIDLILPEMNGLELFRAIRRLRPAQKAMLTTAHTGDARIMQAIAEGALGCINKPFQLEELETALAEAIKPRS